MRKLQKLTSNIQQKCYNPAFNLAINLTFYKNDLEIKFDNKNKNNIYTDSFICSDVNDMDEEYYNNIRIAEESKKEESSPCKMNDTNDSLNQSVSTSEFDLNSEDETEEEN